MLSLLKNTTFLVVTCLTLAVSTATLAVRTAALGAQVATMTASAATAAAAQRKALARTRARARLRRTIAAIPLVGLGAAAYFEKQDFASWQEDNPGGTFGDYSCETAALSAELLDEMLQDLPKGVRPGRDVVLSRLPECLR